MSADGNSFTLPVVAISTNADRLFDYEDGIDVAIEWANIFILLYAPDLELLVVSARDDVGPAGAEHAAAHPATVPAKSADKVRRAGRFLELPDAGRIVVSAAEHLFAVARKGHSADLGCVACQLEARRVPGGKFSSLKSMSR